MQRTGFPNARSATQIKVTKVNARRTPWFHPVVGHSGFALESIAPPDSPCVQHKDGEKSLADKTVSKVRTTGHHS